MYLPTPHHVLNVSYVPVVGTGKQNNVAVIYVGAMWLRLQGQLRREAGETRIVFHAELFPSLLSFEWAFSGVVDSLAQGNFSGGKPQLNMLLL